MLWFKINWLEANCKGHEFNDRDHIPRRFEGKLEMPILRNPRHERFAQELAAGKSAAEAYERAGYVKNFGNCIRLKGNERVSARVAEIQYGSAARAEVSVASLLGELEEARLLALKHGQASAAAQCSMGKAKITGHIIDRREVGDAGAFDDMTDEELVREVAKKARELGFAGPHLVEDDNKNSCKRIWAIARSNRPCATPNWRRAASRTCGAEVVATRHTNGRASQASN